MDLNCLDRRATRGTEQRHHAMLLNEAAAPTPSSPEEKRTGNELIERLYAAIRQLPKVDASLALMHLDGLSYQEMSEVLGISENYIGVKLTRIRKQLAEQLGHPDD
jgi:RNA polymerase sigma-70 factor (ECF subfamily)